MSARLSRETPKYVLQALTILGEQARANGETALLSLGTILQEIKILTPRTKTAYELEAEEMAEERRKALEESK